MYNSFWRVKIIDGFCDFMAINKFLFCRKIARIGKKHGFMREFKIFGKVLEKSGENICVIGENLFTNRNLSVKIYYDTVCIFSNCIKCGKRCCR